MNEGTVFLLLIVIPLGLGLAARHLRNRQRLSLQEMAHQERMLAMERGLPVSELPGGDLEPWSDAASPQGLLEGGWDRRMTLAAGLVMLFASLGSIGYAVLLPGTSEDATFMRMLTGLAVIPLMASFGLLLYYRLTAPKD
jgi:hypothetical protein